VKSSNKSIKFIYPSYYDENGQVVKTKQSLIPSRILPYLAALTPKRFDVKIVDEKVEDLCFSENDDLIALTGMLNNMPRAVDIAKEYKKIGKQVVIGGPGAFALQNEIEQMNCFDSIVIGEAETSWNIVLDDFNKGQLKKVYQYKPLAELKGLPFARFDLLNLKNYRKAITDPRMFAVPIETSRGCPHACKFCLVTQLFGRTIRYRPISDVIDEIKYQRGNYVMFTDDNIALNVDRARELFLAIKPLGIHWFGQFDVTLIKHPEIIKLAGDSGCRSAFIGIESLDEKNLVSIQKKHNLGVEFKELLRLFRMARINTMCSVIFGLDNDSPESMLETATFMIENKVPMMVPWILTPVPTTPLYKQFRDENLLLHNNYSSYDYVHCVFRHSHLDKEELENAYWQAYRYFYNMKAIFFRSLNSKNAISNLKIFLRELYFRNSVFHKRHPFCA